VVGGGQLISAVAEVGDKGVILQAVQEVFKGLLLVGLEHSHRSLICEIESFPVDRFHICPRILYKMGAEYEKAPLKARVMGLIDRVYKGLMQIY
jgi:hypothetical protein